MEVGIKETKEVLKAIEPVLVSVKKIAKDGITAADLVHLIDLVQELEKIAEGVKGIDKVPAELQDLDQAEVMELIGAGYAIADAINKA